MRFDSAETPRPARQADTQQRPPWYAYLAVASIACNIIFFIILLTARGLIGSSLSRANQNLYQSLQTLENDESYTINLQLSEDVVLDQSDELLLRETVKVPVQMTVNVTETVPFNDVIVVPINTTIPFNETVQAPLDIAGTRVYIPVPINLSVPVDLEASTRVDTEVPLSLEIPLDFEIDVALSELIPLTNRNGAPLSIPLDFETQVEVPMDDILHDFHLTDTLSDLHQALSVIESILMLPAPSQADIPADASTKR